MGGCYRYSPPSTVSRSQPVPNLSLEQARIRLEGFKPWATNLHWYARGLLGVAALGFILFLSRRGFWLGWGLLAFLFVFFHLSLVQTFWRAYGKLYPGPRKDRIKKSLLCLVSPWQSARAMDLLEERLWEAFHPWVPGRLYLDPATFAQWVRRWLLELRYPAALGGMPPSPLLLGTTPGEEEKGLAQWLKESGLDPEKLTLPLPASEPANLSYCRRCEVQYQLAEGTCKDCGRPLVPFH